MEKIITLFARNYEGDRAARDEVMPGAEWVLAGEGTATRKWDGTCCRVQGGRLWKRYSARKSDRMPEGFDLAEEVAQKDHRGRDVVKVYGWVPCQRDDPQVKYHWDAWDNAAVLPNGPEDGTYELCGPKVQGGAEPGAIGPAGQPCHALRRHGADVLADAPRTFEGLKSYFQRHDIEGIVWHHPDGRMVKIKGKDFGIARGTQGR